ncbi:MAG TPA: hypothetical protein VHT96_02735 [Clostridia bacterium]|nr:hypothetical protein [Clostridia bacterium]
MNKYMGFFELKALSIPTVPWQQFTRETELNPGLLWTVRTAAESGGDTNLPRTVGVTAMEAEEKGGQFLEAFGGRGIVVYYPYFIAQKSGVMEIAADKTVIEAVDRDLWNLVTDGKKDVTVMVSKEASVAGGPDITSARGPSGMRFIGDAAFLADAELTELLRYASVIRGRFRDEISEGLSIMAEWSYAFNTDIQHEPAGDRYLVFYELRSV